MKYIIYQIRNLVNSKIYVGSSTEKMDRWSKHKHNLRLGTHHNRHLQSAWNKYGAINFIFEILEYADKSKLLEAEQYWIDQTKCYDRRIGYNLNPTAGSPLGLKHSEEARARNSARLTGTKQSEETKLRRSMSLKGRKLSEENKRKIGEANAKALKGRTVPDEVKTKIANNMPQSRINKWNSFNFNGPVLELRKIHNE